MKLWTYANTLIVAIGTVVLLSLLQDFIIPVVLWAFFGFLFDMLWKKISKKILKKDLSKWIWIALLVLSVIVVFVLFWFFLSYLETNFDQFIQALSTALASVESSVLSLPYISEGTLQTALQSLKESFSLESFNGLLGTTFWFMLNAILVLVYAILFIVYREKVSLLLDILIPGEGANHLKVIHKTVYGYAKGLLALVIVVAVLYAVGLWVIGVPYAILIALWSALMTLVPTIGTFVWWMWAIIATGLLSWSLFMAWLVAIWYVIIQVLEEYLILPKVVWKRVELNVFATIISIVAWWMLRWVAWVFLAIPIMWVITKLLENQKSRYADLLE